MLLQLKHSGVVWRTFCPVHSSAAHSSRCVYTTCWSCSVFQQMQMQSESVSDSTEVSVGVVPTDIDAMVNAACQKAFDVLKIS